MKMIVLTDWQSPRKELVNADYITNVMPSKNGGSRIYTVGGTETFVWETPEQVYEIIFGKPVQDVQFNSSFIPTPLNHD